MIDFKNNSDYDSRQEVITVLSAQISSIGSSEGNCVWDLSGIIKQNGKTLSIEVKNRTIPHDKYNDVFAEEMKQTYTKQNYDFDDSICVNIFSDGYMAIANLYDEKGKHFGRMCPKETWPGGDHTLVLKKCISLPQTILLKKTNNKWIRINI